jgi:Ca-activated chloride channel family protein
MDVSGSMRATDVAPDRLRAAQAAASAFIEDLPRGTRVGVVSFAATAAVVQPPTQRREDAVAAIGRFQLQRGTALGSGIIVALATIFPDAGIEVGALAEGRPPGPDDPALTPVPPGSYASAAVILLTDGQRTTGPDTMEAARLAANMGVRVYTVGIGTTDGETIGFEGWSMRVRLDENALKAIARETRGEYFHAGTAEDLRKVYQGLGSRLVLHEEEAEISALFAAAGAALALVAAFLSLLWFARIL